MALLRGATPNCGTSYLLCQVTFDAKLLIMIEICRLLGVLSVSVMDQDWIYTHSCLYPCIMTGINSCNDWVNLLYRSHSWVAWQ